MWNPLSGGVSTLYTVGGEWGNPVTLLTLRRKALDLMKKGIWNLEVCLACRKRLGTSSLELCLACRCWEGEWGVGTRKKGMKSTVWRFKPAVYPRKRHETHCGEV